MAVAELESNGVITHRADFGDGDVFLADVQGFLAGAMASDLGGGGKYPKKFAGQFVAAAVLRIENPTAVSFPFRGNDALRVNHRQAVSTNAGIQGLRIQGQF